MKHKYYVGVKESKKSLNYSHVDIFRDYPKNVEFDTYNGLYIFCYGGYTTMRKAVQVAMYHNYIIDTSQDKSKIYN